MVETPNSKKANITKKKEEGKINILNADIGRPLNFKNHISNYAIPH